MVVGGAVKRSWLTDKEMDEFNHITGDQIRSMTDLRKLRKLERYMREEGFPQTAEAAIETIRTLGGRVLRPGDPEFQFDEYDEEFEFFLKNFDTWKDTIKDADDKLRQLQRAKASKTAALGDNGSSLEQPFPSVRSLPGTPEMPQTPRKKDAHPKKDVRSGREYYERWDKLVTECEKEISEEEKNAGHKKDDKKDEEQTSRSSKTSKMKERNAVKSKSQTEREWLALREREKGNELFKAKEYIASLDAYSLSIELFSGSAAAYANRAAVQLKLNRWDDAVTDCSKALELDPVYVKALIRRGLSNLELDKPDVALKDLTAALELDPSCKETINLKQKAERALKKRQQEVAKLTSKKISIEEIEGKDEPPGSTELLKLEEGNAIQEKAGRKSQAMIEEVGHHAESTSSISLPSESSTKTREPAEVLKTSSDDAALQQQDDSSYLPMRQGPMIIEEIVENESQEQEAFPAHSVHSSGQHTADTEEVAERERIAGNEHFKSGNYFEAIKCYNNSISLDPDVAATFANRGLCYLKMKDWNMAKSDCNEAIKIDRGYAKAYYRRALALEGLGDLREALKDLQAALKVLPEDVELVEKVKTVKRKLRVAFVKEVSKEEAENQKKLEEACRSPSMHEIKTQIGEAASPSSAEPTPALKKRDTDSEAEPDDQVARTRKNFRFSKNTLPSKPRTAIEFQRSCERLQDQPELLRKFIGSIHGDEYPGIFKENLSAEVMRIILKSLQIAFMPHDPVGTMAVLGGLVKVKRFGLILKLLSSSEKNTFLSIFDWLRDSCGAPLDRAQELKAQFY